jgi:uncharacterized membrane protein (DUF441 family)
MKRLPQSILLGLLFAAIPTSLSIGMFEEYGLNLFILTPFIIGIVPPLILGYKNATTFKQSLKSSFITLSIAMIALIIFAIEGLICIIMAMPLLSAITLLGSFIGHKIQNRKSIKSQNIAGILIFLSLISMSFDYKYKPTDLFPVKTSIMINASAQAVWNQVVAFDTIAPPESFFFKTGISYPTDAQIHLGEDTIRYCNFTTGSFVEPITLWNEPHLLTFDVIEQPIPMKEMNPFWDIHPPHLDGYFRSRKGQFKLTVISENQTLLEGTTWYTLDILPQSYWNVWSDYIIHRIHGRVLKHIKKSAEIRT